MSGQCVQYLLPEDDSETCQIKYLDSECLSHPSQDALQITKPQKGQMLESDDVPSICQYPKVRHIARRFTKKEEPNYIEDVPLPATTSSSDVFPMYSANIVSFITYHWLTEFAVTVYKQGEVLKENLWQLHTKDKCATNGARLERLWQKELTDHGLESASLLRVLWGATWRKSMACMIVAMASLACGIIVPTILVRGLLTYNNNDDTRLWYGLTLVLLYFVIEIFNRLLLAGSWALAYQNGVRIRSGLADMLYNKLTRMHTLRDKSVGQIINIFMNDLGRIFEGVTMVPYVLQGPVVAIIAIIYCVLYMGPWALVGASLIIAYYPYQVLLSKAVVALRRKAVVITDSRINLMTEILTHIKLIKLYCWEKAFAKTITATRAREFRILRKAAFVQTMSSAVGPVVPVLAGVLMFLAHILFGNNLTAVQPFVVLSVLYLVRPKIAMTSLIIKSFADSLVAFKRIKAILIMKETPPISSFPKPSDPSVAIEINNGTFAWESLTNQKQEHESNLTNRKQSDVTFPGSESKTSFKTDEEQSFLKPEEYLVESLNNININVRKGQLCGVCGSVGSGKSSLIYAILGQMERIKGSVSISGRVAYVPQEAWILNATLRDNILFGLPFNTKRYDSVLSQCCLATDIDVLPAGDLTEIGERGITLSGGQKQRISLARALYSDYEIYLLDDPMSAVDAHVGQHLFENCIQKALKEKTVLLVTHQLQYLSHCDQVLYMRDGQIEESRTHDELIEKNTKYAYLISTYTDTEEKTETAAEDKNKNNNSKIIKDTPPNIMMETHIFEKNSMEPNKGRLIEKEEVNKGTVTAQTYMSYMRAAGGYIPCVLVLLTFLLPVGCGAFINWWLSYWINQGAANVTVSSGNVTDLANDLSANPANDLSANPANDLSANPANDLSANPANDLSANPANDLSANSDFYYYISVYGAAAVVMILCLVVRGAVYVSTALKASRNLHNTVFSSVLYGPMSFHDTTPVGRTINRFSKDMDDVDVKLPQRSEIFLSNMFSCLVSMVMVCIVFPWFLIALAPIVVMFVLAFRFYHVVLREVKRVDNVTRSPISSCLTTTLQGLSMIHAYSKQQEFRNRFREMHDANQITVMLFCCSNRWLTCRLDLVTTFLTTATALLVVCTKGQIPTSFAGLALVYSAQITGIAQFTVRLASETEAIFTSVERIRHYIQNIPSDAETIITEQPASDWPKQGAVSFKNYCMRYRPQLPLVLNNISCDIRPEEKIGIVGRTGSGKSSLGVGLFRLVEPDSGTIEIDGVDIMTIGLSELRIKLFIIPQDPVLFAGSVRYNLDPFDQYTEHDRWSALARCHIKHKVESLPGGLEALVGESGETFSVGQRQLICLARALLRNAKILILDEATAAIDTETDAQIQTTIKEAFTHCTMLTIAHRLNTVLNYDRIMVLQAGQITEFDTPAELLDRDSHLRALVKAADLS